MAKYTPKTRDELKELVQDESIYLGDIDTSNIVYMYNLFERSERRDFSGIDSWDTSKVVNMNWMFSDAKLFNENINSWDTSSVVDMNSMFWGAKSFNQPLNKWNTSKVTNMNCMFGYAKSFNQPLDKWDISNVVNMRGMFLKAKSFNQPLNSWDTSSVVDMQNMFLEAIKFNQPLDSWDTSSVEFMTRMFKGAESFNQNLNLWNVSSVRDNQEMFWNSGISKLPKWYKKRVFSDDFDAIIEEGRSIAEEAIANPRPKKPKIAPQDKSQNNTDWGSLRQNYDLSKLSLKSKITIAFSILFVVAICFNIFKSMLKDSDTKTQTTQIQTAQPTQQQPAQQPTTDMIRCDDRGLLKHLIQSYKNSLIDANKTDLDTFAIWQETYRKYGINLTSAEELVNGIKYNIINVRTKSSDEVNKQVECEAEIEQIFPIPQSNPYKSYHIIDYRARIANDNGVEFGIIDTRNVDE